MSKKDEALKLALEALEHMCMHTRAKVGYRNKLIGEAMDKAREALAEQQMEAPCRCGKQSVAWCMASGCSKAEQRPSIRVNLDMTGAMATLPKTGSENVVNYQPVISDVGADANIAGIPGMPYGIVPKGTGKITVREARAEQNDPDLQDKDPELVEQHYKQVVDGVREVFDAKRKPAQQQEPVAEDLSDFVTNAVKNRMDAWRQTTDAYVRGNGSEPSFKETLLRGILASELKCWHRLTEDEAQNLVAFVQNMPAKPAQQQEPLNRLDVACDIKTLCVNGDLPDSFEDIADWIAAGSMPAQEQEPVAWVCEASSSDEKHAIDYWPGDVDDLPIGTKLYTSPPAQQGVDWEKLYRLEVKKKEALAAKYERDTGKKLTRIVPMAEQPAQQQEPEPPYEFERYVAGSLRAQGVRVERATTLADAMRIAAKICPPANPPSAPTVLVYTSPPASKPWVGLTDEETGHWAADFLAGAKWAEAKLREKNK